MRQFLKQAMSERGEPSIKRLTLAWFIFLFTLELLVNAIGKQRVLAETLQTQLFELLCGVFAAVVGVNIYNGWKDIKFKQADANQAVGASTPPTDTTTVTPEKPAA
jgi:phosphotransferase system  glucose/maltose/N-acetylglucosamine-specific IIC component